MTGKGWVSDLPDRPEPPCESDEAEDGVHVHAELGCGAACARKHSDEAVDSGDFVQKLHRTNYRQHINTNMTSNTRVVQMTRKRAK